MACCVSDDLLSMYNYVLYVNKHKVVCESNTIYL